MLHSGHEVSILDNFSPQIHPKASSLPHDIASHVRLSTGDVCDRDLLERAMTGVDCIVHLAAETGTGQSMYEVSRYEQANISGTALIYDILAKCKRESIQRIVVASSRSIYGEGAYRCSIDGLVYPHSRSTADKQAGRFDPLCPVCQKECESIGTPESAPLQPSSFYGLTKQVQEQMVLMFGEVLRIPSIALRYQNVYGPGQSLQNPYTGILAIFSNLARIGASIQVFEDGLESRDFVFVDDVVEATKSACLADSIPAAQAINVGAGERISVNEVAQQINAFYGCRSTIATTGAFREGDIRHGLADLTLARQQLDYAPRVAFADGLKRFLEWAAESEPTIQGYERSLAEMEERGLLHGRT
jgi:dTDP-L-rhamnose 4-epimerase